MNEAEADRLAPSDVENCVRIKKKIFGENYYISVGKRFVHFTVPRENDKNMSRERQLLEELAKAINGVRATL